MAGQLIPIPELAPPVPKGITDQQRFELWLDLLYTGEQILLAELRRKLGPDVEIESAYRDWYAKQMEEHDQTMARIIRAGRQRGGNDAS